MATSSEKVRFFWAEGEVESGNNYGAVNASSGALGRWQVMPANLPGWARQAGLPVVSRHYFLTHPRYQDAMVGTILGGYYDRYGPRGAAAMWYSGQPNWHATYGHPPVYEYVAEVIAKMTGAAGPPPSQGGLPGGQVGHDVHPPQEDYSHTIVAASRHYLHAGRAFHDSYRLIRSLRR